MVPLGRGQLTKEERSMAWIDDRKRGDGKTTYYVKERRSHGCGVDILGTFVDDKKSAEDLVAERRLARRSGTAVDPRKGKIELGAWLEQYIAGRDAASTRNAYT